MNCSVDHSAIRVGGFCTKCGLRIEQVESPSTLSEPSVNYCPNGHAVSSKKKFCETCGSPMTSIEGQSNLGFSSGAASSSYTGASGTPNYAHTSSSGAGFAAQPRAFSAFPENSVVRAQKNNTGLFAGLGIAGFLILILIISTLSKGSSGGSNSGDGGGGVYVPTTTTVSVTMSINGQYCNDLSWGYSDIPGGSIILSVDGISTGFASYSYSGTDTASGCDFYANFYNVPTSGSIYSIRMASGLRGTVDNYQYELEANGWQINLSLG